MQAIVNYFNQNYTWKNLSVLFLSALIIRSLVFGLYVQYEERYCQADSRDYHHCALGMATNIGMRRVDNKEPFFWRTPGYPLYVGWFYKLFGLKSAQFNANTPAQKAAIWVQIVLTSFLPILVFFLALVLTQTLALAWAAGWLFVLHLGSILASTYLLTDAIAQLFFVIFCIFFYKSFAFLYEKPNGASYNRQLMYTAVAALLLACYTWLRPNGQFTAILCAILLLFTLLNWRKKLTQVAVFLMAFFICISPWYIRNHELTGHWFFCPMSGPYLQCFNAPKIVRRLTGQDIAQCINLLMHQGNAEIAKEKERVKREEPHLSVSREIVVGKVAWPWIKQYPLYFFMDWIKEVAKTTFDLYSHQLVKFADKSYMWDPLEEFITEKFAECLYQKQMPIAMRVIAWVEFALALLKWLALFGGIALFLIYPLFVRFATSPYIKRMGFLWLKTGLLIGGSVFQSGGFGYARLRLPIEPLMAILVLTFFYYLWIRNSEKQIPIMRRS